MSSPLNSDTELVPSSPDILEPVGTTSESMIQSMDSDMQNEIQTNLLSAGKSNNLNICKTNRENNSRNQ